MQVMISDVLNRDDLWYRNKAHGDYEHIAICSNSICRLLGSCPPKIKFWLSTHPIPKTAGWINMEIYMWLEGRYVYTSFGGNNFGFVDRTSEILTRIFNLTDVSKVLYLRLDRYNREEY